MRLKIGELAKRAGLTVRTLHHYDTIGLLTPSLRTESGARLYGGNDVIRLHRILALKQFGYALQDIQACLDQPTAQPLDIVDEQLRVLDAQLRRTQHLRDRLQVVRHKMHKGATPYDWLTLLEIMTMHDKHFTTDELNTLHGQSDFDEKWAQMTADVQAAINSGVDAASEAAQPLAWRWMQLLSDTTGNNPQIASKLKAMQEQEPRAQEINGVNPAMFTWINAAFAHARTELFSSYLTPPELAEVRRRQLAHIADWPPLFAEVRQHLQAGTPVRDPALQTLARRWQQLFLASYCGDNRVLEEKVRLAFTRESGLMRGVGLDMALILYIQEAIMNLHRLPADPRSAAPKPSAQLVATLRAVHQLMDKPVVFDDPLALKIIGEEAAAALPQQLAAYNDPMHKALRTSLVIRSRVAEDAWAEAASSGVRQYVILGAGLDTYAYRQPALPGRIFEVDLPATQQWKQDCLRAANIAPPAHLRYVATNFEQGGLAQALADSGFQRDQPAFFSWLGVVVYLDEAAIDETLRFIAGCAPGSSVVFDYVLSPAVLKPMEQLAVDLMAKRIAEGGEPWKSQFEPAKLADKLHSLGFATATTLDPEDLNARYLSDREDGMRVGAVSRLMHARVGAQ